MSDGSVSALGLPMPSAEILAALGPENNIPLHRLLPDAVIAIAGKPKQILASSLCAGGELLIASEIARRLQLYFNPNHVEFIAHSGGFPYLAQVSVPNSQDPNAPLQQRVIPLARWATVITFEAPIDLSVLISSLKGEKVDSVVLESLKRTEGHNEYYDLTPQDIITILPQRAAIGLLDECTAVIVEGIEDDIKAIFSDAIPKNAVLDRLKHTPVDDNDWTVIASQEGLPMNSEVFGELLTQIEQVGHIPPKSLSSVTQHLRALTLSLHVSAPVGRPMVSFYAESRDEKGAEFVRDEIQGMIILAQTTIPTMSETEKQALPIPADFAVALLNALSVKIEGTRIYISLNNFETLIPTVAEMIREQQISIQTSIQQEMLQQWRAEQLKGLAALFAKYYAEHQQFPADILDSDGKPLLSWRVALLPAMGLENLYSQFRLDEPWNSETNLALLNAPNPEPLLRVFQAMTPDVAPPKTVVRFFDSAGTPFSNRDLKIEDIKSPATTLMLAIVTPQYAVEWTKPESLEFDRDKLADLFGSQLWGVTFSGQICALPVLPPTDPELGEWKQYVESLIKVLPMPEPPQQTE